MLKRLLVCTAVGVALCALVPTASAADAVPAVGVEATVGGRALADIDANRPLRLTPDEPVVVGLTVTNPGSAAVTVSRVRFDGRVLGLPFFSYTVQVGLVVPAAGTARSTFELALDDLASQATGLLPGRLTLLAPDGSTLASDDVTVDVRGSLRSVYGSFALGVAVLTLVLLGGLLYRLATRRLPLHRWSRAWRFCIPGCGIGLALTVTMSVLRVAVPSDALSLQLVAAGAVIGFVAGYLTPSQLDDGDPEAVYDDEVFAAPSILDLRDPQDRHSHT